MRPTTLAQVAVETLAGDSFDRGLANFLDRFYADPDSKALADEPPLIEGRHEMGAVMDAYLASTAEELARTHGLPMPDWVFKPGRALKRPWFASTLASLRAVLIHESPATFRARNLFVSANALSRA
jgi:hypothetical protein